MVRVAALTWVLCCCRSIAVSAAFHTETHDHPSPVNAPSQVVESVDKLGQDPINSFRLMYPIDGAVETTPVKFHTEIGIASIEEYKRHYGDAFLCVELDGDSKMEACSPMMEPSVVFDALSIGNYTARAFITDREKEVRYHETSDTAFSIVSEETLAAHTAALIATKLPEELSLLEWATEELTQSKERGVMGEGLRVENRVNLSPTIVNTTDTLLIIGVKTAVVENFELRQAIRQTWASVDVLPHDVKVVFLGCVPKLTNTQSAHEQGQLRQAIDMEKQTYGDLLTHELRCEDSYTDLPNKVKEFLRFATQTFPQTPFVMIADDDIYLRADQLADELRKGDRSQRLYIGQVWDTILGRSQTPVRDATARYYIPEDRYPLQTYPPFAFGPHYLISMDCARFISKNSDRLRGLGAMDDVSVALWLLTMQVRVEHTPAFSSLRIRACKNDFLSLADLSRFGIRSIHSNLIEKRDLCYEFDRVAWIKLENNFANEVNIRTYINDLSASKYLEVTSVVSIHDKDDKDSINVTYYPSFETLNAYTQRICAEVYALQEATKSNSLVCRAVALELQAQLQQHVEASEAAGSSDRAFLELWRYNLFAADPDASPLIIAYTYQAGFAFIVLECLFVDIYKHNKRPILVMPEEILREHYGYKPDVFVFSILDADCDPVSKPTCQQAIAAYIDEYLPFDGVNQRSRSTTIIMIAGEPTDTQGLDERVLLLSTVAGLNRKKFAYLTVASTSFSERLDHLPTALLKPAVTSNEQKAAEERRFCAYLYARCDRPQREYMFDILNVVEPVDALGICAGSSRLPDRSYAASRYSTWYNDDAVARFRNYKFVIAFENSGVSGYVTEKLVNPFLAGSIPIYLGNSTTVTQLFNSDSFIDCGRFEKLRDCAAFVIEVHKSSELYERMRREPPIRNVTAFNEAFSWHPSVPSRALAGKVARLLRAQYM